MNFQGGQNLPTVRGKMILEIMKGRAYFPINMPLFQKVSVFVKRVLVPREQESTLFNCCNLALYN